MILCCSKKFKTIIVYNNKVASPSPSKNSSNITFFEDLNFPLNISEEVLRTLLFELQIVTPFPAKPSALTTIGRLQRP